MSQEALCGSCGHLKNSDHEFAGGWTSAMTLQYGSPCNRCNADPNKAQRGAQGYLCEGFREWPLYQIPHPGTYIAIELGCSCSPNANRRAALERQPPVYDQGCTLHAWVCRQTGYCVHPLDGFVWDGIPVEARTDINHSQAHFSCEHCTIPVIECTVCGNRWTDWRVTPQQAGWLKISDETENLKSVWRCSTCRQ